ncbi:MAG: flavohemoglobin expression-modulating QEGLA motif protein [Bacteriovoracia bacterium]
MAWESYKEKVKHLSVRIVNAQRPIRILDSIKWDPTVEAAFKASKGKELPEIDADYYSRMSPGFDLQKKNDEFNEILTDIRTVLGPEDEIGKLLTKITEQYLLVTKLIESRGKRAFWEYSKQLYGSPKDTFPEDTNTIISLGNLLYSILTKVKDERLGPTYPKNLNAEDVVKALSANLGAYFAQDPLTVKISDGIVADASAGGDSIKIRKEASFSSRDISILEVHEGWVHIGTTLNGRHQHVATWLSVGPPRVTSVQEGLAVLMEIITFNSYPRRARRINDRLLAVDKAEDGANFLDIYDFFQTEGYPENECYVNTMRIFRGGVVGGGAPFTKDISYCKGFVEDYNFIRAAIRAGKPEILPFLFVGKLHVDDIPLLYQRYQEGIIDFPTYLPPQFRDLNGLFVWMSFSSFFNRVDLQRIQSRFDRLFKQYL